MATHQPTEWKLLTAVVLYDRFKGVEVVLSIIEALREAYCASNMSGSLRGKSRSSLISSQGRFGLLILCIDARSVVGWQRGVHLLFSDGLKPAPYIIVAYITPHDMCSLRDCLEVVQV
jgi:hypothetical protein